MDVALLDKKLSFVQKQHCQLFWHIIFIELLQIGFCSMHISFFMEKFLEDNNKIKVNLTNEICFNLLKYTEILESHLYCCVATVSLCTVFHLSPGFPKLINTGDKLVLCGIPGLLFVECCLFISV